MCAGADIIGQILETRTRYTVPIVSRKLQYDEKIKATFYLLHTILEIPKAKGDL